MSDPIAPDTPAILQALKALAVGLQINGSPAYKTVHIGTIKDVTDALPLLEVTGMTDETERVTQGGVGQPVLVQDDQTYLLTSVLDYTDSETAELLLAQLRDLLTQALHSSLHLNNTDAVQGVYVQGKGKYGYVLRNGVWYRMHEIPVTIRPYYETILNN